MINVVVLAVDSFDRNAVLVREPLYHVSDEWVCSSVSMPFRYFVVRIRWKWSEYTECEPLSRSYYIGVNQ